jgi:hypothetical protein
MVEVNVQLTCLRVILEPLLGDNFDTASLNPLVKLTTQFPKCRDRSTS